MKLLADYNYVGIESIMAENNLSKFRAKQLWDCIHQAKDFDNSKLPKTDIEKISKDYILKAVNIYDVVLSKDGTKKYLLKLFDGNIVESVFLKQNYGNTICLSTQVGCRMGCTFCASTLKGLIRNLSAGEMLSIIAVLNADNGKSNERNFTNIVLMGSGEPLDNFDNVIDFLHKVNNKEGFNISMRNISLSTCGLVEKIYDLIKLDLDITLCISLHAPNDEIRRKTMPIANKYKIDDIIKALKDYTNKTHRRVILEYCLIDGVNDSQDAVNELAQRFKGLMCHFNVISLNPYDEKYKKPTEKKAHNFVKSLQKAGLSATLRTSKGSDIQSACGQLKIKKVN